MKYTEEIFVKQFPLVKWFIYHLMYYRELRKCENKKFKIPFWVFTTDAHLLHATSLWCMVFGSYNNPTHWKYLAPNKEDQDKLREGFQKAVIAETGFTEEEWKKYWEEIANFRNKYVDHKDDFKNPVPNFDKALEVAYAYDGWIRELFPGSWEEPPLRESTEQAKEQARAVIKIFLKG
jgi:hypothetical protein